MGCAWCIPGVFPPGGGDSGWEHPAALLDCVTLNKVICISVPPRFPVWGYCWCCQCFLKHIESALRSAEKQCTQVYLWCFGSGGLLALSLASGLTQTIVSHSFSYVASLLCSVSSWLKVLVGREVSVGWEECHRHFPRSWAVCKMVRADKKSDVAKLALGIFCI